MRVMWIVAAAIACSGSPPTAKSAAPAPVAVIDAGPAADATPLDQDLPRLVERSLALYQDVAKALADSGNDCKAATTRLGQLAGSYRDVAAANAKVRSEEH